MRDARNETIFLACFLVGRSDILDALQIMYYVHFMSRHKNVGLWKKVPGERGSVKTLWSEGIIVGIRVPRTPEAKRLEELRAAKEIRSLKTFWEGLGGPISPMGEGGYALPVDEEGRYKISYEAVRNYHYDRQPPNHYFIRVAEVYSALVPWLMYGQGGMFDKEETDEETSQPLARAASALSSRIEIPYLEAQQTLDRWVRAACGKGFRGDLLLVIEDFVFELYRERGPTAFGVSYDGWRGGPSFSQTIPKLLISSKDVRRYVRLHLLPTLDWARNAAPWQQSAAVYSLLGSLFIREFGGSRDEEEDLY